MVRMISSVKVERFEPFGKAFCSQHPFAGRACESQDGSRSRSKRDTKSNELVSRVQTEVFKKNRRI